MLRGGVCRRSAYYLAVLRISDEPETAVAALDMHIYGGVYRIICLLLSGQHYAQRSLILRS